MAFQIKENDSRPRWVVALKEDFGQPGESPIDLTTASSVKFLMRLASAVDDTSPKVDDDVHCTVTDAVNGTVEYEWQTGDTDTAGTYEAEVEITWADGGVETVPNADYFDVVVVEDLG